MFTPYFMKLLSDEGMKHACFKKLVEGIWYNTLQDLVNPILDGGGGGANLPPSRFF